MSFPPVSTAPSSPMNVSLFFGDTSVARKYVPALMQNVDPAGFAFTAACKLAPGDTVTPEHDIANGPTCDDDGAACEHALVAADNELCGDNVQLPSYAATLNR